MCTHRAADISEIEINSSYLLELVGSSLYSIVKFAPEPQVNLRNHLPPGDSLFLWMKQFKNSNKTFYCL
jgi:hypothetical protein